MILKYVNDGDNCFIDGLEKTEVQCYSYTDILKRARNRPHACIGTETNINEPPTDLTKTPDTDNTSLNESLLAGDIQNVFDEILDYPSSLFNIFGEALQTVNAIKKPDLFTTIYRIVCSTKSGLFELVTTQATYLMNDNGKTVERLS